MSSKQRMMSKWYFTLSIQFYMVFYMVFTLLGIKYLLFNIFLKKTGLAQSVLCVVHLWMNLMHFLHLEKLKMLW